MGLQELSGMPPPGSPVPLRPAPIHALGAWGSSASEICVLGLCLPELWVLSQRACREMSQEDTVQGLASCKAVLQCLTLLHPTGLLSPSVLPSAAAGPGHPQSISCSTDQCTSGQEAFWGTDFLKWKHHPPNPARNLSHHRPGQASIY